MKWLLICNTKLIDIQNAFKETDVITWPQIDEISVGDIVYFYLSAPHNAIHYKCEVKEKDVHRMNENVSKYVIHPMFYDNRQTYTKLKLLQSFPDGLASEKELREHGVSNLQISSVMSKETADYIDSKSKKGIKKNKKLVGFLALGLVVLIAVISLLGRKQTPTEEPQLEEVSTEENKFQQTVNTKQQVEDFLKEWAEAFAGRNVEYILSHTNDKAQEQYKNQGLLLDYNGTKSLGWSSPWPWGSEPYEILETADNQATIFYTAMLSDPHVSIWRDVVRFELQESGEYLITDSQFEMYEQIDSLDGFLEAYPNGNISDTSVDYLTNELGEVLNHNAKENPEVEDYQKLFNPETAARYLLNLSANESMVETSIVSRNLSENESTVSVVFGDDKDYIEVKMIQPYGANGIWIPQTTNLNFQTTSIAKEGFEIIPGDLSWMEARKACEAKGGHLATITSEEEYEEICELADESGLTYLWIGANLYSETDLWENVGWITGEDWAFSKWYPGEPSKEDVDGAKEYYLCLWKAKYQGEEIGWTFNDQRNDIVEAVSSISGNIGYICEYE